MKIKAWKGGRTERMYARIIPQAKKKLLARIAREGFLSFADWLEAEAERSLTKHAPDVAKAAAQKGVLHKNRSGKRGGSALPANR